MTSVIVLGAGVIGATTAFELAKAGHSVTVIDRQPGPGLETSFANGGQISANHATPWATPEALKKAIGWFGRNDSPLVIRPRFDPMLWSWMIKFLGNCRRAKVAINTERALRVALYSRSCLAQLRKDLDLDYDHKQGGILHLYRRQKDLEDARSQAQAMTEMGCKRDVLGLDEVLQLEPGLRQARGTLAGGILSPDDESGDAYKFLTAVVTASKAQGAAYHFDETVLGFETDRSRVRCVRTNKGDREADMFIMALGSYSPILMKDLDLALPIYPAKGYSITLPVLDSDTAPRMALIDDEFKIVYSRLGNRLRVAGTAEFTGYDLSPNPKRSAMILSKAHEYFPALDDGRTAEHWCGLRPMTPDQVPILGPTQYENLVLNTGHGTLGWTMAAGSARLIADMISGQTPAVSLDGLGLDRFV